MDVDVFSSPFFIQAFIRTRLFYPSPWRSKKTVGRDSFYLPFWWSDIKGGISGTLLAFRLELQPV